MSDRGYEAVKAHFNAVFVAQSEIQGACIGRPLFSGRPGGVPEELRRLQLVNIGATPEESSYDAPNATETEMQLMAEMKKWLGCVDPGKYGGFVTSGGSGSNLFALQTGRDRFIGSGKPLHVLCTSAAHYSNKAALHTLMMENVKEVAMIDGDAMDMTDLRKKLVALPSGANVVLILTSGTTMRGGNDNLRLAGAALLGAGFTPDRFHVHVDGALMAPFLLFGTCIPREIRPSFLQHPFINSICFSGHKALGSTGCCGVLVWNKQFVNKEAFDAVEYTKADSRTGSRSGADVLELYARVFGFSEVCRRKTIDQCLEKAKRLHKRLVDEGVPAKLNECSITVWFPRPPDGFGFSLVYEDNDAHVIAMPQVSQDLLDEFAGKYIGWWKSDGKTK